GSNGTTPQGLIACRTCWSSEGFVAIDVTVPSPQAIAIVTTLSETRFEIEETRIITSADRKRDGELVRHDGYVRERQRPIRRGQNVRTGGVRVRREDHSFGCDPWTSRPRDAPPGVAQFEIREVQTHAPRARPLVPVLVLSKARLCRVVDLIERVVDRAD